MTTEARRRGATLVEFPVPEITGATRLFAVLGDPIAQAQAPALLNRLFVRTGIDAVLIPVHVQPADLEAVVGGLQRTANLDGLLVTVPHKNAAWRFADTQSPTVALTGSTNAMRRNPDGSWFAENFDGVGFIRGLEQAGYAPTGRQVSLVGAGGAGAAIAVGLLDAGALHVSICDPDRRKLTDLLSRLEPRWPGRVRAAETAEADVDLVVNATPLGLYPDDPLPFDPRALPAGCLVVDIIMKPRQTRLLATAAELGFPVHPGFPMLRHQIDLYLAFFGLNGNSGRDTGGH